MSMHVAGSLQYSFAELERRCLVYLERESEKPNMDGVTFALIADVVRGLRELLATNAKLRDEKVDLGKWYEARLERAMDERLKRVASRLGFDSCEDACIEIARLREKVERMREAASRAICNTESNYDAGVFADIADGCLDDDGTTGKPTDTEKGGG